MSISAFKDMDKLRSGRSMVGAGRWERYKEGKDVMREEGTSLKGTLRGRCEEVISSRAFYPALYWLASVARPSGLYPV